MFSRRFIFVKLNKEVVAHILANDIAQYTVSIKESRGQYFEMGDKRITHIIHIYVCFKKE